MTMSGPYSPEELAAQQAYYGGAGISSSAAMPLPADYYGPPPPPADTGPYYNYSPAPDAAAVAPPAQPIRPVGAQLSQVGDPQTAPFSGTSPAQAAASPADYYGPPPVASDTNIPPAVAARSDGTIDRTSGSTLGASLVRSGGAPKGAKTSGGGGPSGPSAYDKANQAFRGTFDQERDATQRGTDAEKSRSALLADGAGNIARQKMDDELIQRVEAQQAAEHFADYQAETQRQIDDVRSQRIQPNRAYADSGSAAIAVFGGVLGGMYQGMNKLQSNPFIDQMNKVIDRDIAAQEHDIATQKGAIGERKGMLADMRTTYKDEALAKLQARNLYYEGAKEQLAAEAATYDSPAIQARADQAIAAINREQAKLDLNEAARKAAAAAAAAGAAEHRRQIDFENQLKLQDTRNKTVTAEAGAAKDRSEAGGGASNDPVATVPKDQRPAAIKERDEHAKTEAAVKRIEHLFRQYGETGITSPGQLGVFKASIATAVKAGAGPGMSSNEDRENFIDPLLPGAFDTAARRAAARNAIIEGLRSSTPTPTLDTHAPGWRKEVLPEFGLDGKPK